MMRTSAVRLAALRVASRAIPTFPGPAARLGVSVRSAQFSRGYAVKNIALTKDTYGITRDARFATLQAEDISYFKSLLSSSGVIEEDLEAYNQDWMGKYRGQSSLVLKPKTVEQVSAILKYCNEKKLAVVPQGGNTGLVGGSVPVFDEVILNLSNMNRIREFDEVSGILVADAGAILEAVDGFLAEKGYIFPLDLGAKGSCHIGGNVATNAGGLRLLRYGSLHGSVLGLEIVLPDGTVLHQLSKLRKDNTGYDLKQLFIGSEGTLGVITGVSILCPKRPKAFNVAFLGLESYEKVQQAFIRAKDELGEILSAFEFMDYESQAITARHIGQELPVGEHKFYVLIETSGSNKEHDDAKLETFLENVLTEEVVSDGVVAQDEAQLQNLWKWRELVPESSTAAGGVYKYDVSIPLPELYQLVVDVRKRLADGGVLGDGEEYSVVDAIGYGHVGDGNLHLNVCVRRYDPEVEKLLEPFVYEWIQSRHGSISAEHGLGFQKRKYIGYSKDAASIAIMKDLKGLFDKNGIMNPYKYIQV